MVAYSVFVVGFWRPHEQMEAGQEARVCVPFPLWHLPVFLHHDRIQCFHVCELAHVQRSLTQAADCRENFPLTCAIQPTAGVS